MLGRLSVSLCIWVKNTAFFIRIYLHSHNEWAAEPESKPKQSAVMITPSLHYSALSI